MNNRDLVALIIMVVGLFSSGCASVPVEEMSTTDVVLSKELADTQGTTLVPKNVTEDFDLSDPVVNVLVTVRWPAAGDSGGVKAIRWEWWTGDQLVSQVDARFNFYTTPFTLLGNIPTRTLGVGTHKVKLFIEDVEFAVTEFQIASD